MAKTSSLAGAALVAGLLLTLAILPGASTPKAAEDQPFPVLTPDGEPLRAAFNRDAGRVRLLLFIDPT
jgi:hypothetical protein